MTTQEALTLMDREVQSINYQEGTLTIDSTPENGFKLFFITFDGQLAMKNEENRKNFKISFMVEGKVNYE